MVKVNTRLQGKDEELAQKRKKTRLKKTLTKQQRKAEKLLYKEKVTNNKLTRHTGEILISERELNNPKTPPTTEEANFELQENERISLKQHAERLREIREVLIAQTENAKKITDIENSIGLMDNLTEKTDLNEIIENPATPEETKDDVRNHIYRSLTGRKITKIKPSKQRTHADKQPKDVVAENAIRNLNQRAG